MKAADCSPFEAYAAAYSVFVEAVPGFRIAPIGRPGSLVCAVTPFPLANFNRVMSVRLSEDEVEQTIEAVTAVHRAAGVPSSWWLDPDATPLAIEGALVRHGYGAHDAAPLMAMELTDLPEMEVQSGGRLSFVDGRRQMREAQLVVAAGFERPPELIEQLADAFAPLGDSPGGPVRVVVATMGGAPVASATAVVVGDVAGVLNVATLPEARGKGLGRAATLAVLHNARQRGARTAVLHASEMGFNLYARMGFRHVGDFRRFAPR